MTSEHQNAATELTRSLIDVFDDLLAQCREGADRFEAGVRAANALARLKKPNGMTLTPVVDLEQLFSVVALASYPERLPELDQEVDGFRNRLADLPFEAMQGITEGMRESGVRLELDSDVEMPSERPFDPDIPM